MLTLNKKAKSTLWCECNGTATIENNVKVPQKTKKELAYDPAIPLLGIYPEKTNLKRYAQWNITQPLKRIHLNQF